jgi:hypothetical protein
MKHSKGGVLAGGFLAVTLALSGLNLTPPPSHC